MIAGSAMAVLSLGLCWWAGTFFYLGAGNLAGRSLLRAVARLERALVATGEQLAEANAKLSAATYKLEHIDRTAREEAEASMAEVAVEVALRDGRVGRAEDEVNRRLAQAANAKVVEMPAPKLPGNSAWEKRA